MTGLKRPAAAATIGATGVLVAAPNGAALLGTLDVAGLVLAVLGLVIGVVLTAGAGYLVVSDISTEHIVRVAGWNGLGVVVLGLVLGLSSVTADVALPAYAAAVVLGVSAVAHVLIGVNDVRRIRATELAREREKLAVLNRLARHNLRNDAQVLTGVADVIADETPREVREDVAERVQTVGENLASTTTRLKEMQAVVDDDATPEPRSLAALVESAVDDCLTEYPDATVETDVPDVPVRASTHLSTALYHLIENAIVHTDTAVVRVTGSVEGETATVSVSDDGPGIPEMEREVVTGERERTQLEHASGLGLWVVKTVVEELNGTLSFGDGGEVSVRLPTA